MGGRIRHACAMIGACSFLGGTCGVAESGSSGFDEGVCARVVADGGDTVPAPPDGASLCPPGPCNYQTQSGCAPGHTCQPTFTRGKGIEAGCSRAGERARGEACGAKDACARGLVCAGGFCRKLCCGRDWSACDEGESCFRQLQFSIDDVPTDTGAWLCFPVDTCSVLDSVACGPGRDCKLVDPTGNEACVPHSGEPVGAACSGAALCDRGLTCVHGTCRRLCAAESCGEPGCPDGEGTCVHFNRNPPGVGECTPNL
jgi:hypothetical protein